MSRFYGIDELVIILAVALLVYVRTSSAATISVGERMFLGFSREEMVEMAGYGEEKLSTVLITGSVVCEGSLRHPWRPVSGALIVVECSGEGKNGRPVRIRDVTDEDGDFTIDLPSQLHAVDDLQDKCYVKLLRTPRNSPCRPSNFRERKSVRLSSVWNGVRTYEAGTIKLPLDCSRSL